jgi:hypothetical protein
MIHVCLEASPETFDGYGLTKEFHAWLRSNMGIPANDMNSFIWGQNTFYHRITKSRMNPRYSPIRSGEKHSDPYFLHFLFKDVGDATMFKLTWGGVQQ